MARALLLLALLPLQGCIIFVETKDDDSGGDADVDSDSDADTDVGPLDGAVEGTVTVTLYTLDEAGDLVYLDWEDTCFGETWPYGRILVNATATDPTTGEEVYLAEDVVESPSTEGADNAFHLDIDADEAEEVRIWAVLDKWNDGIIGASDPVGLWPDPVAPRDGETIGDVEIEIVTPKWCDASDGPCTDCPPWWSDACYYWDGGWRVHDHCGGGCDVMTLSGPIEVEVPWNSGDACIFLMEPGSGEPYYVYGGLPLAGRDTDGDGTFEGADGTFAASLCQGIGTWSVRGVWDSNGNGLYDPADTWGQVVAEDGTALDTVTIGASDLLDQRVRLPVAGSEIGVVPFVRLGGEVYLEGGTYDDLLADSPGASVWVAALKYRPNVDITVDDLEGGYDWQSFGPDALAGEDAVSFSLVVPGNATVYLWAYADADGDGLLNEHGEPVGSAPSDEGSGRISTGASSRDDIEIGLVVVEE